jgi:hypothetical protein
MKPNMSSRATRRNLRRELQKRTGKTIAWAGLTLKKGEHAKPGVHKIHHVVSRSETYDANGGKNDASTRRAERTAVNEEIADEARMAKAIV